MPSILPGHLYTFVALIAVSGILIFTFMDYTEAVRFSSETRQLKNLVDAISAKCTGVLTLAKTANASAEVFVDMPSSIGNKQYWLSLRNDSRHAWVEGGFGLTPTMVTELRAYIPCGVDASGHYFASHGPARLSCHLQGKTEAIELSGVGG